MYNCQFILTVIFDLKINYFRSFNSIYFRLNLLLRVNLKILKGSLATSDCCYNTVDCTSSDCVTMITTLLHNFKGLASQFFVWTSAIYTCNYSCLTSKCSILFLFSSGNATSMHPTPVKLIGDEITGYIVCARNAKKLFFFCNFSSIYTMNHHDLLP